MKAGKRKAGPGRKPAGTIRSKVSNFSTRITAETRVALETEARATEQSVSQVAEQLLRLGIRTKRQREQPDALRAFCYLVAELAELICNYKQADGKPVFDWRTTPFTFEAFRLAIQKLMDAIKPSGEIRSPTDDEPTLANSLMWAGPYNSPQARAEWATMILWHNLQSAEPGRLTPEMFSPPITVDELTELERVEYTMARARHDLQIEFRRSRP
jgi:hypothetical protein